MKIIKKYEIKSDIRDIIAEIDYEEYMFNKIFKTNVVFKNSFKKFNLIYTIHGSKAYKKYVPTTYQKQDIVNLINTKEYTALCDRHGKKIFKNLVYTVKLEHLKNYCGSIRAFFYSFFHMFSRQKLKLKCDTPLMLPESIPTYKELKRDIINNKQSTIAD